MIDPDALHVWHGGRLVGFLWRDGQDRIGFRYDQEWQKTGFALGRQLPLSASDFPSEQGVAHTWFANLLPEGGARERVVRERRLSDSDFALLSALGEDCAGALSLLPPEMDPGTSGEYRQISDSAFAQIVKRRGLSDWPMDLPGQPARHSLAGAQAKWPVYHDGGAFSLPTAAAPSSHILKFEVPEFRHVPIYEAFLNRLASALDLPVARTDLHFHGDAPYLLIERFDRIDAGGSLQRLHQEDFNQISGVRPSRKYEVDGGPSIVDCLDALRQASENPAVDVLRLLRWQAFNYLAGNSDGHAKNLAMLQVEADSSRWRLAPFYDLVCTRAIERVETQLAMGVGGERDPRRIGRDHWQAFARQASMQPRFCAETSGRHGRTTQGDGSRGGDQTAERRPGTANATTLDSSDRQAM
jgi:serine/threonine-protein kinase HipA